MLRVGLLANSENFLHELRAAISYSDYPKPKRVTSGGMRKAAEVQCAYACGGARRPELELTWIKALRTGGSDTLLRRDRI